MEKGFAWKYILGLLKLSEFDLERTTTNLHSPVDRLVVLIDYHRSFSCSVESILFYVEVFMQYYDLRIIRADNVADPCRRFLAAFGGFAALCARSNRLNRQDMQKKKLFYLSM